MAASYSEASPPPIASSTFVPLSPRPYWAGQGTRLPCARLQHKAESGEGKSSTGVHSRGGSPALAMRRRPSGGQHNFSDPKVGFLGSFSVVKPTSRSLPLPDRPSSPGTAREKLKGPTPPFCVPRTVLIPVPPATRTSAPSRSHAVSAAPKLARVQRAGRPGSPALGAQPTVWFELGSAERALWPWPLHPFGSLAEARPLRWPTRQPRERVTPGAATGRRTQTHVESFFLIESREPVKAPLCGTP